MGTIRFVGFSMPSIYAKRLAPVIALLMARIVESGRLDRYRRTLATLTVDGKDMAATMISEGLARPYHGERRQGWCG